MRLWENRFFIIYVIVGSCQSVDFRTVIALRVDEARISTRNIEEHELSGGSQAKLDEYIEVIHIFRHNKQRC